MCVDSWSGKLVRDRLVAAFAGAGGALLARRSLPDELARLEGRPLTGLDLLAAAARHLGRGSRAHRDLMLYAWARGNGGVRALCRERGWPRGSFYRRVLRAAEEVAHGLNGGAFQASLPLCACA